MSIKPSWAADKDGEDQIVGLGENKITWNRLLWDTEELFSIESNKFSPRTSAVFYANGKVVVTPNQHVTEMYLWLYRNDEKYWCCDQRTTISPGKPTTLKVGDDIDGYVTSGHYFDLRIEVIGSEEASVTISGEDVKTAFGMSFVTELAGDSPT